MGIKGVKPEIPKEKKNFVLNCSGNGMTVTVFADGKRVQIPFYEGKAEATVHGKPITKGMVEALKKEPGWGKDFWLEK